MVASSKMSQNCGGNKYTFRFLSRLLFWTSERNDFPHDREKTLKSKTVFFIILGISSIILGKCGGIVDLPLTCFEKPSQN